MTAAARTDRARPARRQRSRRPLVLAPLLILGLLVCTAGAAGVAWRTGYLEEAVWWLTNATPPVLDSPAPAGPQRGAFEVPVALTPEGRAFLVAATLDGAPLTIPASSSTAASPQRPGRGGDAGTEAPLRLTLDTAALPDGHHTLRVEAEDRSRRRNRSALDVTFVSDNTAPRISVTGAPARLRAGAPTALRIAVDEPAQLDVHGGDTQWTVVQLPLAGAEHAANLLVLAGTPPNTASGELVLRLAARDTAGNVSEHVTRVLVDAATLPRQALVVPASLAALATGPVATGEASQLAALMVGVRPDRLWSGEFRMPLPAAAARTTGFGDRRDYADGHVVFHGGFDLAAPEGTPVLAVATGAVAFAGSLPQRGNTVVLDHGWGVYSLYAHLVQPGVQVGQMVTQGQPVGAVGSTGLSTGPHLHWEIRLRGQAVDPAAWLALSRELP